MIRENEELRTVKCCFNCAYSWLDMKALQKVETKEDIILECDADTAEEFVFPENICKNWRPR